MPTFTLELRPSWLEKPAEVTYTFIPGDKGDDQSPPTYDELTISSVLAKGYLKGDPDVELIGIVSDSALDELYVMINQEREPDYYYEEAA